MVGAGHHIGDVGFHQEVPDRVGQLAVVLAMSTKAGKTPSVNSLTSGYGKGVAGGVGRVAIGKGEDLQPLDVRPGRVGLGRAVMCRRYPREHRL